MKYYYIEVICNGLKEIRLYQIHLDIPKSFAEFVVPISEETIFSIHNFFINNGWGARLNSSIFTRL